MLTLPFQQYISTASQEDVKNKIGSLLTVTYNKLSLADSFILERLVRRTRGVAKIKYGTFFYLVMSMEVTYSSSETAITLVLMQVA